MTAKDISEALSEEDIINLLLHLGANNPVRVNGVLTFNTICHGGDSHKLYYYSTNKNFHCYTHCGHIGSVFDLVMTVLNINFTDAYLYVCNFFNIRADKNNTDKDIKSDNSFIKKFTQKDEIAYNLKHHDINVLNNFDRLYHISWLNDNISKDAMRVFDIRFDILNNRIIIPHHDAKGNLIGIRCRNLNDKDVVDGRKYMPVTIDDKQYNYPTHANFYGLNINKKAIIKYKRVILVESEKAVLQLYSYYGEDCIAIACSGSSISSYQISLLIELGVENVIIAMDKDFKKIGDVDELSNRQKIKKAFIDKLITFFNIEVIWDFDDVLDYKDSPTDKGKDVWMDLFKKRLYI